MRHCCGTVGLLAVIFLLPACATTGRDPVSDVKRANYLESTSRNVFERIEPSLKQLQTGQPLDDTGLRWKANEIRSGNGKLGGVRVRSDGWFPALSGGIDGALTKFGVLSGRSGDLISGQHVYGFVWGGINMVPKYLVSTQAEIISKEEYHRLSELHTGNIGEVQTGPKATIYFKNLTVKEVQPLDFPGPPASDTLHLGKPITVSSYRESYLSLEQFQAGEQRVKDLQKGMSVMEVVRSLDGKFLSNETGETVGILGMKGFLNISQTYRWTRITPDGIFAIWPFGYMEGTKEVPRLALIFKNGKVSKVVPYSSKEELERQFSED